MRRIRLTFVFAALCSAGAVCAEGVTAAAAQSPTPQQAPQQPQVGFFSPTTGDDPSLYRTLPPEAYPPAPAQGGNAQSGAANAAPPMVVVVPDPNAEARAQFDRAQLEAQQAAARMAQAPAPINGAFTGATDEADRR